MSLTPYRFFDPSQIPQNIIWMVIGWGARYGFKKLLEHYPIKINKNQIWRNFQWFKIIIHILSFVSCLYIRSFWDFIDLHFMKNQFDKIAIFNVKSGFVAFKKLDPVAADYLYTKLKEWITKLQ